MTTNALHSASPDALLERLAASGLRGRGGGWFDTERAAVGAAVQEQRR